MKYIPEPHQVSALRFALTERSCGLFMRMGTGKTVVSLTLAEKLIYEAFRVRRVLLFAPIRVCRLTWPDEIAKWDHTKKLTYNFIHGTKKDELLEKSFEADITAVNFEGARWLANNWNKAPRFDMLIVDESTWIKNHGAGRTKLIQDMSRFIPFRIILTGSPTPNSLQDLWAQMFIVDRGARLGSCITHYRNNYFFPDSDRRSYYLQTGAKEKIIAKIRDKVLVVEDKDLKGMPEVVNNIVRIQLPPKIMKKYKELERDFFTVLDSGHNIEALNSQAKTQKMRQFVTGFVYENDYSVVKIHNERCKVLKELIESINDNVLVAIQFKAEVQLIQEYFKKDIPFINSQSKDKDDDKNIRLWQQGRLPILLAHPASIGHGLNLQSGGCNVIWFSQTWSLEEWEQYIARLARKGQKNDRVFNHCILADESVDLPIFQAVSRKDSTQRDVLNKLREWREQNG